MPSEDWEEVARNYLAGRAISTNTRKTYERNILRFLRWCAARGTRLNDVTPATIADYEYDMKRAKPETQQTRLLAIRLFFDHLVESGVFLSNPAVRFGRVEIDRSATRPVLSLAQLAAVWRDTSDLQDRVIVGLLGICGIRVRELLKARVEQLSTRAGVLVLDLPDRNGPHEFDHVAIPRELARDLSLLTGGRTSGPILLGRRRGRPFATEQAIRLAVERATRPLSLPHKVQPSTLTLTLRALAIEHGFSYVAVVRSVSESEPRRLAAWVRRIHTPQQEQASYQLGQLISQTSESTDHLLLQAERLVFDRSQPPTAGLLLSAIALERLLRSRLMEHEEIRREDAHIAFYAGRLRALKLIANIDHETITRVATLRNFAAHGHLEQFSRADAEWVLDQCTSLSRRLATAIDSHA